MFSSFLVFLLLFGGCCCSPGDQDNPKKLYFNELNIRDVREPEKLEFVELRSYGYSQSMSLQVRACHQKRSPDKSFLCFHCRDIILWA